MNYEGILNNMKSNSKVYQIYKETIKHISKATREVKEEHLKTLMPVWEQRKEKRYV